MKNFFVVSLNGKVLKILLSEISALVYVSTFSKFLIDSKSLSYYKVSFFKFLLLCIMQFINRSILTILRVSRSLKKDLFLMRTAISMRSLKNSPLMICVLIFQVLCLAMLLTALLYLMSAISTSFNSWMPLSMQ